MGLGCLGGGGGMWAEVAEGGVINGTSQFFLPCCIIQIFD